MEKHKHERSTFSGKIGFVLSAAGASVGLGNIWRFPYLAAKYGGGIFLLIYIILALTFGYSMIVAETALGRMTKKSPVGAFGTFGKSKWLSLGGWINAIIPVLIVPYYSVIGGWVIKYLVEYVKGGQPDSCRGRIFFCFYLGWIFYRNLFPVFYTAYADDHLCRRAEWRGTSFQSNDADTGFLVCSHCRLFSNKTGSTGRCEIFPDTKYQKLLLDDSGCGNGTDVLFSVDRDGDSGNFWFLYEKGCIY